MKWGEFMSSLRGRGFISSSDSAKISLLIVWALATVMAIVVFCLRQDLITAVVLVFSAYQFLEAVEL